MRKLFGTDGVRGVANIEPMTSEIALKLGRAAAYVFQQEVHRHRIVIGKDTRLSGYMLESALISGICSMGVDVLLVGPLPTPGIAFITKSLRADAGVVISASHNSYEDNGIKFFSKNGLKLPDDIEKQIENLVLSDEIDHIRPVKKDVGKAFRIDDAEGRYIEFIKNSFPRNINLEGLKIVVDCANGAAYKVAPAVLRELGAEVVVYNDRPDGRNINFNCGSLYPEIIQKAIIEHQADIGITHDGDADRVILADEKGKVINGDHIMAICALDLMEKKRLNKKTLVTTVMSNIGLDITIKNAGGTLIRTDVGDRYVAEEMIKGNYNLGGEQSGHMIFMDFHTTGDGIITALQVLSIMKGKDKKLSELASVMVSLPQVLVNVKVKEKKNISEISEIDNKIKMVSEKLNNTGRILVRYSGTESLARIMIEGEDEKMIKTMADGIAELIRKHLG